MTIKQISIFVENRTGALAGVLRTLRDNNISIIFSTLADTEGFGLYRVVCDDTQRAYELLKAQGVTVKMSYAYAVRLADNRPGAAAEMISTITEAGIGVKYMYSFLYQGKGIVIFKADDNDKADSVIAQHKLDVLADEDFK